MMSLKEAMDALQVSRSFLYVLRDRGELHILTKSPAAKKGGPAVIPREDVDAILAKRAQ